MQPKLRIADDGSRAMPRKINFSVERIDAIKPPAKGRVWIYDARVTGLALMVSASGVRTFYLYRKVNGRPVRVKLGRLGDITLDQARTKAATMNIDVADGKDPGSRRRAVRESETLGELFDRYVDEYSSMHCTESTRTTDKSRMDTCFDDWRNRRVLTITESEVGAKHLAIARERGKMSANRAMQLLRRLLNWGKVKPNPVTKDSVKFYRENKRVRFLQPDEMERFLAALKVEGNATIRDCVKLALFTGARRGNLQSMEWTELNLDTAVWTIPAAKAKAKEAVPVHLPQPAVDILTARKAANDVKPEAERSPYVFPGRVRGHLQEVKAAWKNILKRAKITDLHVHDLRHSLASWCVATGASLSIIGRQLGHQDVQTTARYAHLAIDPVRAAVDAAVSAMQATANGKAGKSGGAVQEITGSLGELD